MEEKNNTTNQPNWVKCRVCGFHFESSSKNMEIRNDGVILGLCYNCENNEVLVEVDKKELEKNNYIWADADSSPDTIIVRGRLSNKKRTAFLP